MTRPLSDSQVCADGTCYAVHSELVRGEPRWYWVVRQPPNEPAEGVREHDGAYDRRKMQRLARRLAIEHDKDTEA